MKQCSKCKQTLDFSSFATNNTKKDGKQSQCKLCNIAQQKLYYKARADYYKEKSKIRKIKVVKEFKEYKKTLKCAKCNESEPCCLDFHHTDKDLKVSEISLLVNSGNTGQLKAELEKCIVLCANCHRKLHAGLA